MSSKIYPKYLKFDYTSDHEKMHLYLLMLHTETAFDCMVELGYAGTIQFVNIDEDTHAPNMMYTHDLSRCNEMLQIIDLIEKELKDCKINPTFYPNVDQDFRPVESDIPEIEKKLRECEQKLAENQENRTELLKRKYNLLEWRYAISKSHNFLLSDNVGERRGSQLLYSDDVITSLVHDDTNPMVGDSKLHYLAGTIPAERFSSFKLMLYRFFGRNILIRYAEIPEEIPDLNTTLKKPPSRKYVVLLMNISTWMSAKVLKICSSFSVTIFPVPESPKAREKRISDMTDELREIDRILDQIEDDRRKLLHRCKADLLIWKAIVKKAGMTYAILNRLDIIHHIDNQKYLHTECWLVYKNVKKTRERLKNAAKSRQSFDDSSLIFPPLLLKISPQLNQEAPTHFELNKFTRGFQNLIDSYGMACYRELNPAPYTIITFPFLFAVMFGDIGHGIILTLFGASLIIKEKKIQKYQDESNSENEIVHILFAGRYIILLMGLFSIYVGGIYNDMLSLATNAFGTSWFTNMTIDEMKSSKDEPLDPVTSYTGEPYVFGVDPVWDFSGEDSITTFNSLKMKLAIILGVTHMMFGLTLGAINGIKQEKRVDFFLVALPQIIFMTCIFCYLVFLIFYKWLNFGGHYEHPYNTGCAPLILILFIDMVLFKNSNTLPPDCNQKMYKSEQTVELILYVIALLCVPVLLAGKPIYLILEQRGIKKAESASLNRDTLHSFRSSLKYNVSYEEEAAEAVLQTKLDTVSDIVHFDVSEIWIHSGIHTIECVLGSVSHTASYLRLWALSLAHDQLSAVLWKMVLRKGFYGTNSIGIKAAILVPAFFMWAVLTIAILVAMEGLSAFLHTLRLHWVEFQSKFYTGTGIIFSPFHFERSTARG